MGNKGIKYTNDEVWDLITHIETNTSLKRSFSYIEFRFWAQRLKEVVSDLRKDKIMDWDWAERLRKDKIMYGDVDLYKLIYKVKYEELPLYINNTGIYHRTFIKWRLRIGK